MMITLRYGLISIASASMIAGALWFNRSNPSVIQAQDIIELRQAVIERCLATQHLPANTTPSVYTYGAYFRVGDTSGTFTYGTPDGVRTGLIGVAEWINTNVVWTNTWANNLRISPPIDPVIDITYAGSNQVEMTYQEIVAPDWWDEEWVGAWGPEWYEYGNSITLTNIGMMPMSRVVFGAVVDTYTINSTGLAGIDSALIYSTPGSGLWPYYVWDSRYPEAADAVVTQILWNITATDVTNTFIEAGSTNIIGTRSITTNIHGRISTNDYVWAGFNEFPIRVVTNTMSVTNITITNVWPNVTNISYTIETNVVPLWPTRKTSILDSRYSVLSKFKRSDISGQSGWVTSNCTAFALQGCAAYGYWAPDADYTPDDYWGYWEGGHPADTNSIPANTWTLDFQADASAIDYETFKTMITSSDIFDSSKGIWTRSYEAGPPMVSVMVQYGSNGYWNIRHINGIEIYSAATNTFYHANIKVRQASPQVYALNNIIESRVDFWIRSRALESYEVPVNQFWMCGYAPDDGHMSVTAQHLDFDDCNLRIAKDVYFKTYRQVNFVNQSSIVFADAFLPDPMPMSALPWPTDPSQSTNVTYGGADYPGYSPVYEGNEGVWEATVRTEQRGFVIDGSAATALWNFQYCIP